jgi:hypothetical protein
MLMKAQLLKTCGKLWQLFDEEFALFTSLLLLRPVNVLLVFGSIIAKAVIGGYSGYCRSPLGLCRSGRGM